MLNPEVRYSVTDRLWTALGANIFGGNKNWTRFGMMDRNDNIYLQMRYEF
jgi:hypothetical protein